MGTDRAGQFAGLGAAVLFGCSAPLISTLTGSGSGLSIADLLYAGATLGLLAVRLVRGTRAETPIRREDWPALAALTLLGGVVGPVALVLGLARWSTATGRWCSTSRRCSSLAPGPWQEQHGTTRELPLLSRPGGRA